ncbi:Phox homologous domain-containing protein [Diplogelasinospora grovesii]|uniref:Endosomal/vacuolar adapter protein YPT35 n=1 Tax=Diplogelasinospora grovesii TaxID=303347 RepID=A0AAN6NC98_9PEZI|nr:Phox homologous domain-containing protein [Diplogelasinospora grovesii]
MESEIEHHRQDSEQHQHHNGSTNMNADADPSSRKPTGTDTGGANGTVVNRGEPSLRADGARPNAPAPANAAEREPLFLDSRTSDDFSDDAAGRSSNDTTSSGRGVTSPPYWMQMHGHNPHNRNVSNVSAESVLLPGAITLQDNEHDDGPGGSNVYGRDRNRACWAKSVEVTDYIMVNGGATSIGAFVVWNIRVETLNGSYMNIRKRYSEFDDLRHRLVQTFPNFEAAVPSLPPKSVISKFRPKFLEKRRVGLQYFLNCILLNPEFSGSPVLKEFLFS